VDIVGGYEKPLTYATGPATLNEESVTLMQRMEDSSLRQLWRLTILLIKIRNGVLA
jgi:hypothetical protein